MVDIKVTTTGYTVDGQTEVTAKVPLAAAIRKAEEFPEGAVITVVSNLTQPINIGGPVGNENKDECAYWKTKPISNVTIRSTHRRFCSITNVTFWEGLKGINDIKFSNLKIINTSYEFAPIRTAMNEVHGHIMIDGCIFIGSGYNWLGKGMKWGIRGHGPARWTILNCTFDPCEEHSIYIDNPQGNTTIENCLGRSNGRTFIQITNRPTSGPSQFGNILVKGCQAFDMDNSGGGGSDYTFVGCTEKLSVENCSSYNTQNGAFVCWTDTYNGTYPVDENYSFKNVVVKNFTGTSTRATRPMFAMSGVKEAQLFDITLGGGSMKYRFGGDYGGPRPNGNIEMF